MTDKVFYSWQSDLPSNTNRTFIQNALEKAAKEIRADNSIEVEPVIDRDTAGVPGSPDIASTIFDKIEQAQVFVCDVSIINHDTKEARFTPNPNVLLELGYALKVLGSHRILMVMNKAFGGPELLPFDLRLKRVTAYYLPKENEERAPERTKLAGLLESGLRTIFEGLNREVPGEIIQSVSIGEQAREAVENNSPNKMPLVRRYMEWLTQEIKASDLIFTEKTEDEEYKRLVQAVRQSHGVMVDFARLCQSVAECNDADAAQKIYEQFGDILKEYDLHPPITPGVQPHSDSHDFYKYIGHELFVIFFSFLIRSRRWDTITTLFEHKYYIYSPSKGAEVEKSFDYVNRTVQCLIEASKTLHRVSPRADLLKELHSRGELAPLVSMEQFMDTEFFLFLRGELQEALVERWIPHSLICMQGRTPRFLSDATSRVRAEELLKPLGVKGNVEILRGKLVDSKMELGKLFVNSWDVYMLDGFDLNTIGTR